jgi:hypothetical protein
MLLVAHGASWLATDDAVTDMAFLLLVQCVDAMRAMKMKKPMPVVIVAVTTDILGEQVT